MTVLCVPSACSIYNTNYRQGSVDTCIKQLLFVFMIIFFRYFTFRRELLLEVSIHPHVNIQICKKKNDCKFF